MTPGDPLNVPGGEYLLCAASIEQARLGVFLPIRAELETIGGFRFADSGEPNRHYSLVYGYAAAGDGFSAGRRAMGIVGCPLLVADEPGSWDVNNGRLMFDAIQTAQGKPGSALRAIYIGTLAPFGLPGHWWHNLIADGSPRLHLHPRRYRATRKRGIAGIRSVKQTRWWRSAARFRRKLLEERDEARADSRLRARFLSYRLNVPSGDESSVLLTVADWEHVVARDVPPPFGRPVVGIDLGGGRAWSAAVALWPNGRCEALADFAGHPGTLSEQEKRDRVPPGTYGVLAQSGALSLADGLRVPPPRLLWERVRDAWGHPRMVLCDRFRLNELRDAVGGRTPLFPRRTRWSEASADIRALRHLAKDGPAGGGEAIATVDDRQSGQGDGPK